MIRLENMKKYTKWTQLDVMQTNDILKRVKYRGKIADSPVRKLPSVSKFYLKLGEWNEMLKKVGLKRRMEGKIESEGHPTKRMNRYMTHQIQRLDKCRNTPRKYWFIAQCCIRFSISFRVAAFIHAFPRWYKEMPLTYAINIMKRATEIVRDNIDELEFKRTYIPKGDWMERYNKGEEVKEEEMKWRPLGVPKHAWRVVLHMHSNFITYFVMKNTMKENQHAYLPGKGTLTAWKELLNKINKYKYIYEIDLRGCFDNIAGEWVTEILKKAGVPPRYYYYLENINRNCPKFKEEDLIDESVLRDKKKIQELVRKGITAEETSIFDAYNSMPLLDKEEVKRIAEEEGMSMHEFIQMQWAIMDSFSPTSVGNSHKGLPQGANTSPILTEIVLNENFTSQAEDSVFYADDGIFFGNEPFDIKSDMEKGIEINQEKSGWIKWDGEWKKDLKFLGLKYKPEEDTIEGYTRKGSRLNLKVEMKEVFALLSKFKPSYGTWSGLFNKTVLGGIVQSKLYQGSWIDKETKEDVSLVGIRKSWLDMKNRIDNQIRTSSDATLALADIMENCVLKNSQGKVKILKEVPKKAKIRSKNWWMWKR